MSPDMQDLLRNHIKACNDQTALERTHCQQVAELNARAIFLNSLGNVPPKLQQEVQKVLMPSGEAIQTKGDK